MSAGGGGAQLQPTFTGYVATTQDALVLFEACLQGHLSHVPRRPHDRERSSLIRSGCVFIYEENASGIKRWTDGVTWSPSRILGNFLIYRELDKPFPPGEKKKAHKKPNRKPTESGEPYSRGDGSSGSYSPTTPSSSTFGTDRATAEIERQLIGSLVDSYGFKDAGLVKKTMSISVQGVTHHLVSYYNVGDIVANRLRAPTQTESLQYIRPRVELTSKQSFRSPLDELDDGVDSPRDGMAAQYYRPTGPPGYSQNSYYMAPPYPPMAHQPPAGYPPGPPPMHNSYMPGPALNPPMQQQQQHPQHPQQQHRPNEYGSFDHAYGRAYEPVHHALPSLVHSKSVPATPTNAVQPQFPDRPHQPQSALFPQHGIQSRSVTNLSPVSMDARSPGPYSRLGFPQNGSHGEGPHRAQPSPSQMKYDDRRESQPQQQPQPPYYGDNAPPPMNQGQYPPNQSMSPWQGQSNGH